MREMNNIVRNKKIYQLDNYKEFLKGEWLTLLPENDYVEVSYKTNNHILIVNDMKSKKKIDDTEN